MEFLIDLFKALLLAGVPVAVFTLVLVRWALNRGYFQETSNTRALGREMKAMRKSRKKGNGSEQAPQHPLQKKWAKFGGGFYGIMAFFTYIVVETTDITTTIVNFGGFMDFLKQLNIGLVINMLIEALTNFITAMIWPAYWLDRIDSNQPWVWLAIAYGGYWLGLKQAQAMVRRRRVDQT